MFTICPPGPMSGECCDPPVRRPFEIHAIDLSLGGAPGNIIPVYIPCEWLNAGSTGDVIPVADFVFTTRRLGTVTR